MDTASGKVRTRSRVMPREEPVLLPQRWIDWLSKTLTLLVMIGAAALLLGYGWLALRWQSQPFLGVLVSPTMVVGGLNRLSAEPWPAYEAGVRPGDRIVAVNDDVLDADYRLAWQQLNTALSAHRPGDTITLRVMRSAGAGSTGDLQCEADASDSGGGAMLICTAAFALGQFPLADFLGLFLISFGFGVALLGLAGAVLRVRWDQPVARLVAVFSALLAVIVAGSFDVYTTHVLSPQPYLAAASLLGGVMLALALSFPVTLPIARRRSWLFPLAWVPAVAVLIYTLLSAYPSDPALFWRPWAVVMGFVLLAMLVVLVGLLRRLRRVVSPVIRDQTAVALLSLLLSVVPLVVWLLSLVLQDTLQSAHIGFSFSFVTPFFLLFPLGMVYGLAQKRLPDSDRLLGQGVVYGVMGVVVALGYGLVVVGFSLLAGSLVPGNNPLVIAATVFLMMLLFVPVRNMLERRVNAYYFRTQRLYQRRIENLAQTLTRVSTLSGVAEAVREQLEETLSPTHTILFFPDVDNERYVAHGVPTPETDIRFSARSPLVQMLSARRQVLYLEPGQPLPPELAPERTRLAVLGTPIFVPLVGQDRLRGFIAIGPQESGARYTHDDLRFLQGVGDQVALAVERAQVVSDLERRLRELDVLGQVAQAVNFTIEFDDLLELIYAQTNRVIDAANFYIVLHDPHAEELYYAFYSENDERIAEREGVRWRMGRDLMSDIVRTGRPIQVENYAAEAARRGSHNWLDNPQMRAWMGAPLNAPTATLGVICVGSTSPGVTYTDEQLKILWQIADQAATAIDKARLFREAQLRARQLAALNEISTQLATVFQEPDRLLELITESAVNILEAEAGSLLMIDPETGELEFKVAIGSGADDLVGTRLPAGTGLVGTVADRGEPVIVNDTTRDPRWFSGVDADTEFRTTTLLAVPLKASTGVIGVLEVINKRDGGVFVDDDKRLLTTFAGQAAIAIENARLFQMTDRQLAARVQELDTMQKIDRELNETLDLHRVLEITLEWALRESGASAGLLAMVNEEPPGLRIMAHYGYPDAVVERFGELWPLDHGVMGRVARLGQPELVADVSLDDDYVESLPGTLSQLTVPLFTGGEVRGVIMLESQEKNAFTLLHLDFVSRLAEHASPALANASLFARLEEANEARSEFVSFVAHELRTPMTSIRGFADLLLGGVVGPLNDQQKGFLNTIRANVERMTTLVSDLNDVTKLQTNRMHMEMAPLNFRDVVEETLRPLQAQIDDRHQMVSVQLPDPLPHIYADRNRLIQVLTNLVSNAHKYTPPGGTITIAAEVSRNIWDQAGVSEVLHFYVQDNGIGISEADQLKLFTPYFRSENPTALEQPGTGLGLVIVRGIVEQHGGQIWVESTLGEGTTFHVTVPLARAVAQRQA